MKTTEGDYAGFTNEGDVGAISFKYDANRRTLFVGQNAAAMTRVGDEFQFNNRLQAVFSLAVQLSTGQLISHYIGVHCASKALSFCEKTSYVVKVVANL